MEADTTYSRALAARAYAELSRRNAAAADSLRAMATVRRDAGDASDMDVALATLAAGQAANQAAADSMAFTSALLDLQSVMGIATPEVVIVLGDSLIPPVPDEISRADGALLPVAAADAQLEAASLGVRLERRSLFGTPSLVLGVETGDPSGGEPGRLPTVGLALPIPLFNRNRSGVAMAQAEEARARAERSLATVLANAALTRARREYSTARSSIRRDATLIEQANKVAAMSMTAYCEGAASMANVLEAQRVVRDQYLLMVAHITDAWIARAELQVLTLTAPQVTP
jgi:cobalt-zinc-cadmium efflux system outer membrane protein